MTKRQRFMELVRMAVEQRVSDNDAALACIDCFVFMPDNLIPDQQSLRFFANDVVNYFVKANDYCAMNYPSAATYIRKWKKRWLKRPCDAHYIPVDHPAVVWSTDDVLNITEVSGEALKEAGFARSDIVGRAVQEVWGTFDLDHPLIKAHVLSLRGETTDDEIRMENHLWRFTTAPRYNGSMIVGVDAVAIRLPPLATQKVVGTSAPSLHYPVCLWKADHNMNVIHAAGGGFLSMGTHPSLFVGTNLRDWYDEHDWEAVQEQYAQSLTGVVQANTLNLQGKTWHVVTCPLTEHRIIVGTLTTAILLPAEPGRAVPDVAVRQVRPRRG